MVEAAGIETHGFSSPRLTCHHIVRIWRGFSRGDFPLVTLRDPLLRHQQCQGNAVLRMQQQHVAGPHRGAGAAPTGTAICFSWSKSRRGALELAELVSPIPPLALMTILKSYDDISLFVARVDVAVGLDDLVERVAPIDHRFELSRLGQTCEKAQVLCAPAYWTSDDFLPARHRHPGGLEHVGQCTENQKKASPLLQRAFAPGEWR